jgi:hypothetical protein
VRKTISIALPDPYSDCLDVNNLQSPIFDEFRRQGKRYQQTACYELCKQLTIIDKCGCASIEVPNINNTRVCNQREEIDCVLSHLFELDTVEKCEHYCPLECYTLTYQTTSSFEDLLKFLIFELNFQT